MNPRLQAIAILSDVLIRKKSLTEAFKVHLVGKEIAGQALVKEMSYGVLRFYGKLNAIAEQLLIKKLKAKDQDIFFLILLGLYQLLEMNIPSYAVVKETVDVTISLHKVWAKQLVNAVLRRFQREKDALLSGIAQNEAAIYSHPAWMLAAFRQDWPDAWREIAKNNNVKPPLTLRVNLKKITREEYLQTLSVAGLTAHPHPWIHTAILVLTPTDVTMLPGFAEGMVSVQDASAQLAAVLLAPEPGQSVLDACAAPGGKTLHLLEQEPTLDVVAIDHDDTRLRRIEENLVRANLHAKLVHADASQTEKWWDKQHYFDRVLLDAPCTATGVIRRHPDIKWLRQQQDVMQTAALQAKLLNALWLLLKVGGILVYCTCSVLKSENIKLLQTFVATHPECSEIKIKEIEGIELSIGKQILPSFENDGFYYAKFKKES